jgi:hypothetical protein
VKNGRITTPYLTRLVLSYDRKESLFILATTVAGDTAVSLVTSASIFNTPQKSEPGTPELLAGNYGKAEPGTPELLAGNYDKSEPGTPELLAGNYDRSEPGTRELLAGNYGRSKLVIT